LTLHHAVLSFASRLDTEVRTPAKAALRPVERQYSAKEFGRCNKAIYLAAKWAFARRSLSAPPRGASGADSLAVSVMERKPIGQRPSVGVRPQSIAELCDQSDAGRCKADTVVGVGFERCFKWRAWIPTVTLL